MDRFELVKYLESFRLKCSEKGRHLTEICVEDAFPGDASTSYIIRIKAPWVDKMYCSDALDFLFDTLWETTSADVRKKVFSIRVLDSKDELHCEQEASAVGV